MAQGILSYDELALLRIMQIPKLTAKALKATSEHVVLFDRTVAPHLAILWGCFMKTLSNYKGKDKLRMSRQLVSAGMTEALAAEKLPEMIREKCVQIIQGITETAPEQAYEEGLELLRRLVKFDANRKFLAQINSNSDLRQLREQLDASQRVFNAIDGTQNSDSGFRILPLRSVESLMVHRDRVPLGVSFLDKLSHGGGRTKEVWTILGPSGGGKTMLTVQLSVAQLLMGNYCIWATYEQSMEGDLTERMVANILGGGLSGLRDQSFDNLAEDQKKRYWAAIAGLDEKLITYDMTKAEPLSPDDAQYDRGVYAIWQNVKKERAAGRNIKIVLIDWLGEMVMMLMGDKNLDPDRQYRAVATQQIALARQMAEAEDLLVIFWHQLSTKAQDARPTYRPTKGDAHNMKSVAYNMDYMFALGVRDKNNVAYFRAVKSRKGDVKECMVQLVGESARFNEVYGWVPGRDGNFYKPTEDMNSEESAYDVDVQSDAAASYKREV